MCCVLCIGNKGILYMVYTSSYDSDISGDVSVYDSVYMYMIVRQYQRKEGESGVYI